MKLAKRDIKEIVYRVLLMLSGFAIVFYGAKTMELWALNVGTENIIGIGGAFILLTRIYKYCILLVRGVRKWKRKLNAGISYKMIEGLGGELRKW